jgi:hypothetical protein
MNILKILYANLKIRKTTNNSTNTLLGRGLGEPGTDVAVVLAQAQNHKGDEMAPVGSTE